MTDFARLEAVLDKFMADWKSGAQKVMAHNPSWSEFLMLLNEDEQRAFWAFYLAMLKRSAVPA